jgi:hypothetical protein
VGVLITHKVALLEVIDMQRTHQCGIDRHLVLSVRWVVCTSLSRGLARRNIAPMKGGLRHFTGSMRWPVRRN